MLAGERPFKGEDLTETLASVVKDQSDLSKTPLPVRKLLAKCLEKDPKRRLRDIGDAWDLLDQANSQQGAAAPRAPAWRRMLPWAIAAGFALVAAITATLYVRQPVATSDGAVRFQLSAALQAIASSPVVSPDGRHIAYQTGSQILVRDLDATAPRAIATSDASVGSPFWSGDSRFVLFDAGGRLTRVDVAGGPPQTVCDLPGILSRWLWNPRRSALFHDAPRRAAAGADPGRRANARREPPPAVAARRQSAAARRPLRLCRRRHTRRDGA